MSSFPPPTAYQHRRNQLPATEFRCDRATLVRHAKALASLVRGARFFVAFTGAGVSTAAGLADYRGAGGTLTMRARGGPEPGYRNPLTLRPTLTHMSLVALERAGLLRGLVSQNTDALHRRSGFPPEKLAELHGNTAIEWCPSCGTEVVHDFRTRADLPPDVRATGRPCPTCRDAPSLQHSIVLFGYPLRPQVLERARDWSRRADLCLVLGSSLTVNPASRLPLECLESGGKLVVCNLQATPRDNRCSLRLFAETDSLMSLVMSELGLAIPEWSLTRRLRLEPLIVDGRCRLVRLRLLDSLGNQLAYLKSLRATDSQGESIPLTRREPFDVPTDNRGEFVDLDLEFYGHFGEPSLRVRLTHALPRVPDDCDIWLSLTAQGSWTVSTAPSAAGVDVALLANRTADGVVEIGLGSR